jgi:hypothetical protein
MQSILMLDDHKIPIEIWPGAKERLIVRTGEDHDSIRRGVDRRAELVRELYAVMRFPRPVGCCPVPIRCIHRIVSRQMDRSLEDEMTIRDAKIFTEGITESF